ncbi:hypothetical protein EPUS_00474 [Endocarpon pusillum Z07020]|uniref:Uncharacterized protein n=1 Tax=Endocarpon pusillum (strain Z07020 / HMAS-L-300199) TaxID=1263415 RepID=U1HME6_ENDPU|nr:uncharacterized protein EPUS_00474 [Endocarpon pusillum Z07020]ERF71485.1 hypothetical protein EPUS_00474 [Endocarpon pusillum Z07020]
MSISIDRSLQDAIREFQGVLSPDQSNQLQAINAVPDTAAVITFVAQLDEKNAQRRASGVATRLYTILDYNHIAPFKQARKRRHGNTAQWLTQSQEFNRWMNEPGSSVFWCSGKLGSGKTILTANVINHLFLHRNGIDVCIGFFFCRYDEAISLKAEVILRSIIRQSLDATNLPRDIEVSLEDISQSVLSGIDELQSLLQKKVALSQVYYIVVDALDECEKSERDLVLDVLQSVIALSHSKVKLFLASRDSIGRDIRKQFPSLQHLSMGSSEALSDISTYTRETLDARFSGGDLVIGDRQLLKEIQDALIQGAEGMFLWVAFQIDDICSQHSDEDIRQALRNLPKDLTETFNRALSRILAKGDAKTVKQVFRWVAAAKRPLSLGELREAIAIEPCQPYSKPERLLNGMSRVPAWCENLIVVDEEDEVVQFAHHTVQQYLLEKPLEKRLSEFHFQLQDADLEVGESCVTYLNFNDFKTKLIRRPKFQAPITPSAILETALGYRAESTVATSLFQSVVSRRRQKTTKVDVAQKLACYGEGNNENLPGKLQLEHPFLDYASENWLLHTTNFEHGKSKTWSLWTQMLLDEQSLGQTPWTHEQFISRDLEVGKWICDENHSALLRLIQSSDRKFPVEERMYFIRYMSMKGNLTLYEHFSSSELAAVLQGACEAGHFKIVDKLLAAKADVNAVGKHGRNALQTAAQADHVEIVDKLLATKADVNAVGEYGQTALQIAAQRGHVEIVDKLLAAKAGVNAVGEYSQTALQAAASKGYIEIVDKLLAANADVDAVGEYGQTALQIAAQRGHVEIVDKLLAAKADVDAVSDYGQTAL